MRARVWINGACVVLCGGAMVLAQVRAPLIAGGTLSEEIQGPLEEALAADMVLFQNARPARSPSDDPIYFIRIYPFTGTTPDPYAEDHIGVYGYALQQLEQGEPEPTKPAPPTAPPASPSSAPAASPPASTPPAAQPSLDELLGIKPAKPPERPAAHDATAPKPGNAPDAGRVELERALTGEELEEAFKRAVTLMGDAATRLDGHRDVGLDTQRIQEEALKHLESVLNSLQQNSSSQSQQQPRPQQGDQPKNQPRPRPQQANQPSQRPNQPGQATGPELKEGALNPALESARAAWGALPERIRETLFQGMADQYSAQYRQLTEEYYRRLAQDPDKKP